MGKYRILEPVVFLKGNKVVRHRKPADLVQLDDSVAKELGDKVEPRGADAPADEQPAEQPQPVAVPKTSRNKAAE